MADDEIQEVPEYATLVDRTGGPGEFFYAGRPLTFTKSKPTRQVPIHVAIWALAPHRHRVWTTDGAFVHRFTIQDGPEALLTELGEEAFDTSPITIDTERVEGTDTEHDGPMRTITLKRQPGEFSDRHAAGAQPSFVGKER